jgi:hypothetical protein
LNQAVDRDATAVFDAEVRQKLGVVKETLEDVVSDDVVRNSRVVDDWRTQNKVFEFWKPWRCEPWTGGEGRIVG